MQEEEEDDEKNKEVDAEAGTDTITVIRTAAGGGADRVRAETQLVKLQRMFVKLYQEKYIAY